MRSERVDEMLLVRYLLGDLTEEEQVQVEDRAFEDAEYLGALEAAEADLIDSYVRGELSQLERRGFERRFLTSPQRRSKVEFARALAMLAAESNAAGLAPPERRSAGQSFLALIVGWNPVFQFAAGTAALICVTGGSWLMVQNAAMRSRVAALEARSRALESREQGLRNELVAHSQKQPSQAAAPPAPVAASLVFLPGLTRAETRREQLVLSSTAQIAHIEIQLETRDNYPRFRAEIHTLSGEEILIRGNLLRRPTPAGYVVSFDVPASALPTGEYELALRGIAGGQPADVGYYYFRVQKQ